MSEPHRIWTKLDKGYSLTTESIGREVGPPVAVPGGPVQPDGCIELLRAAVGVRVSEAEGVHGEWSGGPCNPPPRACRGLTATPTSQREDFLDGHFSLHTGHPIGGGCLVLRTPQVGWRLGVL